MANLTALYYSKGNNQPREIVLLTFKFLPDSIQFIWNATTVQNMGTFENLEHSCNFLATEIWPKLMLVWSSKPLVHILTDNTGAGFAEELTLSYILPQISER